MSKKSQPTKGSKDPAQGTPIELAADEQLAKRLDELVKQGGLKQFTKAVMEAELVQINQELLHIKNEQTKRAQTQVVKEALK